MEALGAEEEGGMTLVGALLRTRGLQKHED